MAENEVMASADPADQAMDGINADLAPLQTDEVLGEPNKAAGDDGFDFIDEVGKEVPLTGDGGLIKKVITAGEGWESPETGDEVTVHYVGTLEDGSQFDSSRERDAPFIFTLGQGRVIKGWDLGVAKMKRGEKALLICKPDYAYGTQGSPPKIPPNATLHFEVELLTWRSDKDISGDGGIIKNVLLEGNSWQACGELFDAKVSYTARVAGSETPFASVSESEGVWFPAAEGLLVPAVGVAVKTMKKGERAELKVKSAYGFGEAGSAQYGVGPNSDLEIELALLDWHQVEHLSPGGGVVMKTLITAKEEDYKKPNEGARVTAWVTGKVLPDGPVFLRHQEASGDQPLVFTTGEEQVCEGLEAAVMKMKKGERAVVTITDAAQGYGSETEFAGPLAAVPPGSALQFEVELAEFENSKESWEMNDSEKVEAARQLKDKGNAFYKAGKLSKAQSLWEKAVSLVQYDKSFPEDAKSVGREVKRSCWLNLAAMDIKQAAWKEALRNCTLVLEVDSQNVKALYRRAQAQMALKEYFEAELDLKKALSWEPNNTDVLALMRKLKVAVKEQNKKEASLYSKMFKPSAAKESAAALAAEGSGGPMATPATAADEAESAPAAAAAPEAAAAEVEAVPMEAQVAEAATA